MIEKIKIKEKKRKDNKITQRKKRIKTINKKYSND
jgi:hypothetical protein